VIFATESINIANLVCDKKTLFMSDIDIIISPEVHPDSNVKNGCIFVAARNIVIAEGDYRSNASTTSQSETLNGFLIAGNSVVIDDVDVNRPLSDILKINGGLVAFGEGADGVSLKWNRSLTT
jgi:hypothetical protein